MSKTDDTIERIIRQSERKRIAAWLRSCREDDSKRPVVQLFDVLADQVEAGKHWDKK